MNQNVAQLTKTDKLLLKTGVGFVGALILWTAAPLLFLVIGAIGAVVGWVRLVRWARRTDRAERDLHAIQSMWAEEA